MEAETKKCGLEYDHSDGCSHSRTFFFQCRDCNRPIKMEIGCGNRFEQFCPVCSKKWQKKTRNRYFTGCSTFRSPKFITLTLRKEGGRIEERLMQLWEMRKRLFFYLRRSGYKIRGWCGVIEPPNHIHMIVDCDWIPKAELSETWSLITGDSFIVDIKKIDLFKDPRKVFSYITKYMTKASAWTGVNLTLLKGFHLVGSRDLFKAAKRPIVRCLCGTLQPYQRIPEEGYLALLPEGRIVFGWKDGCLDEDVRWIEGRSMKANRKCT